MRDHHRTGTETPEHLAALEAKARHDLAEAEREIDAEVDENPADTDDSIDTRAGALPREGVPSDVPDTQESLYSEDGAYRVDENEGEGDRNADPAEVDAEADGLEILSEEELKRSGE